MDPAVRSAPFIRKARVPVRSCCCIRREIWWAADNLEIEAVLAADAQVLLTTPAANRFYKSSGKQVQLRQKESSWLEWLPQETLVYDCAIARQPLRVEFAPGAHFIGWEITRFGRSACDERFT